VRVYVIDRNYQPTEIELPGVASQFVAWFTQDSNPLLNAIIQSWLWQPTDIGGLGVLAESAWDIALLRAEITAAWERSQPGSGSDESARL
jgi:hypothetical protein